MADKIHRSRISNTEWGLVIGALLIIDIIQIVLTLLAIGLVVNRIIDVLVGMTFAFYLHIRGEKLQDPKRLLGFLAAFVGEMIPVVDSFPLWSADGVYNFFLARWRNRDADKQAKEEQEIKKKQTVEIQQERNMRLQEIRMRQQEERMANQE